MEMLDLIEQYKKRLENNPNDYTCILFALQIPSICSRIEFPQTSENTGNCSKGKLYKPNGNPWDVNMYKTWLIKHNNSFVDIYHSSMELNAFCEAVYDLRCQVTHEIDKSVSDKLEKFIADTKLSKTATVEKALEEYINKYNKTGKI